MDRTYKKSPPLVFLLCSFIEIS